MPANNQSVIIIGAGPTGLTLGIRLTQAGIPCHLIDRLSAPQTTSRAAVIHARTLERLEPAGVSDRLVEAGLRLGTASLRHGRSTPVRLDFTTLPTRYPFVLALPQNQTEAILTQRLTELGGSIGRGQEAVALRQDADGVTVTVKDTAGETTDLRGRFAVGTDGYHSITRPQAGIGFNPGTYPQSFILADVHMDWPFAADEMVLFLAPFGIALLVPFPGGHARIVATQDNAPAEPSLTDMREVVARCGPQVAPTRVRDVIWSSRFRVHHGIAERYRTGRVLLAGDAAHVHSPAGGQGMNTGIQDALSLADRLVSVIRDGQPDAMLDGYEAERRPVARHVVNMTDKMTRIGVLRGPVGQTLRNAGLSLIGHLPPVRARIAAQMAELSL